MRNNITVLYVDDEDINLLVFEKNFEDKFSVITALSGQDGLTKLNQHSDEIAVVISDMKMPLMNGVEFIKKAHEDFDHIAYFILSGFQYNEEIDQAVKSNLVRKFFTKPMNMEEIESAIKTAVDQE